MINKSNIKIIKETLGMKSLSCFECDALECGSDGDYGEYPYYNCWDKKRKHLENLKHFPFTTDQRCCCPNFDCTKFSEQYEWEGGEIENRRLLNQYFIELEYLGF